MKSIPENEEELERLKFYEDLHKADNSKKTRKVVERKSTQGNNGGSAQKIGNKSFNPEDSQAVLLNQS